MKAESLVNCLAVHVAARRQLHADPDRDVGEAGLEALGGGSPVASLRRIETCWIAAP